METYRQSSIMAPPRCYDVWRTAMHRLFFWIASACLLSAESLDRTVAEWTLTMGGSVGIAGRAGLIHDIAGLPAGEIQLDVVDWLGVNVDPPDLQRLSGLTALKELHLPGPIWNRNADSARDGSRDLRFIDSIHTLESLTFGYHFLD